MEKSLESDSKPLRLDELKDNQEEFKSKDEKRDRKRNAKGINEDKGNGIGGSQSCRESQSIFSGYLSKSLSTFNYNGRPQSVDQEIVKIINKPLPPPSTFSGFGSRTGTQGSNIVTSESNIRNFKIITPSITADAFNTLVTSSYENSSSYSRCQSANLVKTHKKYENLLSKHYGYICPRNK